MGTKRMNEDDLQKMGLQDNGDGTYSKKKTVQQPRDILYKDESGKTILKVKEFQGYKGFDAKRFLENSQIANRDLQFRKISLTLFGEPMPKQSVRSTKTGHHYQPQKVVDKLKDYQSQIRKQLPKDFKMFETCVFVRKMHFLYAPLKSFHKEKGKMEAIRNGKKYYKNSRPDLPDNLKKLVNDSMSGLVFTDDSLIVSEDNIKKYYSVGGCVIIDLEGY